MNLAAHIENLQQSLAERDLVILTIRQLLREALDDHECADGDCWCGRARRVCNDHH